tara:strand:+ start:105 stop:353 length:249 start_codon:yes stop_codon:yes gene_type:complete
MFIHNEVEAKKTGKLYQMLKCTVNQWKVFCSKNKIKPVEYETSIQYQGEIYVLGEKRRDFPNEVALWKGGVAVNESEVTIVR